MQPCIHVAGPLGPSSQHVTLQSLHLLHSFFLRQAIINGRLATIWQHAPGKPLPLVLPALRAAGRSKAAKDIVALGSFSDGFVVGDFGFWVYYFRGSLDVFLQGFLYQCLDYRYLMLGLHGFTISGVSWMFARNFHRAALSPRLGGGGCPRPVGLPFSGHPGHGVWRGNPSS